MDANTVIASATCFGVFVALGGVIVAWIQLSGVRDTLKINALMAVLDIEAQMTARKETLDKVSTKIRMAVATDPVSGAKFADILSDERKVALENYLNSIDRLCYCVLKNYFLERDWRTEYRTMLQRTIEENNSEFAAGSPYKNMIDLNNKWQRE
jgi:hypothetical protein